MDGKNVEAKKLFPKAFPNIEKYKKYEELYGNISSQLSYTNAMFAKMPNVTATGIY